MSTVEDEQQTRVERARAIGLFPLHADQGGGRHELVAAAARGDGAGGRGALTRTRSGVWCGCPVDSGPVDSGPVDRRVARDGFDTLVPSPRQAQARTPAEVLELAATLKKENPDRSAESFQVTQRVITTPSMDRVD